MKIFVQHWWQYVTLFFTNRVYRSCILCFRCRILLFIVFWVSLTLLLLLMYFDEQEARNITLFNLAKDSLLSIITGIILYFVTVVVPEKQRKSDNKKFILKSINELNSSMQKFSYEIKDIVTEAAPPRLSSHEIETYANLASKIIQLSETLMERNDCFFYNQLDVYSKIANNQLLGLICTKEFFDQILQCNEETKNLHLAFCEVYSSYREMYKKMIEKELIHYSKHVIFR